VPSGRRLTGYRYCSGKDRCSRGGSCNLLLHLTLAVNNGEPQCRECPIQDVERVLPRAPLPGLGPVFQRRSTCRLFSSSANLQILGKVLGSHSKKWRICFSRLRTAPAPSMEIILRYIIVHSSPQSSLRARVNTCYAREAASPRLVKHSFTTAC
jgi:hypothetical protein